MVFLIRCLDAVGLQEGRASLYRLNQGRSRPSTPNSEGKLARDLVPGLIGDALVDSLVGEHPHSMLKQSDEDQDAGAFASGEHLFVQERLGRSAVDPATEGLFPDQPSSDRIEPARNPANHQAKLKSEQNPQLVGRPPAPETPRSDTGTERAQCAADQRALPSHFRVRVTAFGHVDDELAGGLLFRRRRRCMNCFSVGSGEEGFDSPGHGAG